MPLPVCPFELTPRLRLPAMTAFDRPAWLGVLASSVFGVVSRPSAGPDQPIEFSASRRGSSQGTSSNGAQGAIEMEAAMETALDAESQLHYSTL